MTKTVHHTAHCHFQRTLIEERHRRPTEPIETPGCACPSTEDAWRVRVNDGKYEVVFGEGRLSALRYGEPWRDLVGDNLIYWLGADLNDARRALKLADLEATQTRTASLAENRVKAGADGTVRKAHYGPGRQPWDDIVDAGWAPAFAAGCVLRYLRRDKAREHSLESARWYYARLIEGTAEEGDERTHSVWSDAVFQLEELLTLDELIEIRRVK